MRLATFPLCIFSICVSVTANASDATFTPLLDNIERRIDIAQAVALHKWDHRQPVQDTPREQQVLANVRRGAAEHDLDPERAATFFGDQIETSKLMQWNLLNQWHLTGSAPDIPRRDLATEIRPELDRLQDNLLRDLASFDRNALPDCSQQLAHAIAQRASDAPRRLNLIRATAHLCPTP